MIYAEGTLGGRVEEGGSRLFRRSEDVIIRRIAEETILVPVRSQTSDLDSIYTLTEVGSRIWDLLRNSIGTRDIVEAVWEEFEVERQEAGKDTVEFLSTLEKEGLVVRC